MMRRARTPEPLVIDAGHMPEGPFVTDQTLSWVDMSAGAVHELSLKNRARSVTQVAGLVSAAIPRQLDGYAVAVTDLGHAGRAEAGRFAFLSRGALVESTPPILSPGHRMNDAKCDSSGRLWAGSATWNFDEGQGALYRWNADGTVSVMERGLSLPNGLGWSADDRRFYLADSVERMLYSYRYDPDTGVITDRRVLCAFDEHQGRPDGLAVDVEGCVWVAFYGGGCVRRIGPDGRTLTTIQFPASQITSCAFGAGTELLVTTARQSLSVTALAVQPLAGAIFSVDVGVGGVPLSLAA